MKRKVILITGFQNWGKTRTIQALFNGRRRFRHGCEYAISGVNGSFIVETRSNDDLGLQRFINFVTLRISRASNQNADLLAAFCPTREPYNDSSAILDHSLFGPFDEIHLILLKYKYDNHAKLQMSIIENYLRTNVANPAKLSFHHEATSQLDANGLIDHNIRLSNIISIINRI
ncbi:MAG: hypothetical protein KF690_11070 [Bacteroidetes bacterium]|nr:hypothetical protein [Bacteroidota bacterium]